MRGDVTGLLWRGFPGSAALTLWGERCTFSAGIWRRAGETITPFADREIGAPRGQMQRRLQRCPLDGGRDRAECWGKLFFGRGGRDGEVYRGGELLAGGGVRAGVGGWAAVRRFRHRVRAHIDQGQRD